MIKVIGGLAGVGVGLGVLAGVLIATGDPKPCVDRKSTPSDAAAQSMQARWDAFKLAPPGATIALTEEEVTSRAISYVSERDVPIKNLQVYFCPDGKAEAKGTASFLGRDINIVFRGHLDVSGGKNTLVVDSVDAGNLPSAVGKQIVDQLLNRNDVRDVPLGIVLTSSVSQDGIHTLKH